MFSDKTFDAKQWQHVTITYDTDTKKVTFYVNGESDGEKAAGNAETNALTDLLIRRHKNAGNDPLSKRGLVDEIRVYDKVLTAEEAKAVYESKAEQCSSHSYRKLLKRRKH